MMLYEDEDSEGWLMEVFWKLCSNLEDAKNKLLWIIRGQTHQAIELQNTAPQWKAVGKPQTLLESRFQELYKPAKAHSNPGNVWARTMTMTVRTESFVSPLTPWQWPCTEQKGELLQKKPCRYFFCHVWGGSLEDQIKKLFLVPLPGKSPSNR